MRHYSAAAPRALHTESEMVDRLRAGLRETSKPALAKRLGITEWRLSSILRGVHPLPECVAAKLGFRRVARFEKVS